MSRYNLALLPAKQTIQFIQLAKTFRDNAAIDYILGEHSLPHITLAQFRTDDWLLLEKLWQQLMEQLRLNEFKELALQLKGLDLYQDPQNKDAVWLQLLPQYDPVLYNLHNAAVSILHQNNLFPLNKSADLYEPHLTLIHTTNLAYIDRYKEYQMNIADIFYPALGESDEAGQFVRVIKQFG